MDRLLATISKVFFKDFYQFACSLFGFFTSTLKTLGKHIIYVAFPVSQCDFFQPMGLKLSGF